MSAPDTTATGDPFLDVRGVSKRYGGTTALHEVRLAAEAGEVHGVIGANGAGKSTLGKIISGAIRPDAGAVFIAGRKAVLRSPRDALKAAIVRIGQEPTLVRTLNAADNVFLGQESLRHGVISARESRRRFQQLASSVGFSVRGDRIAGRLSLADQQKVEIMRALSRDARLVVMDEPTAALAPEEIGHVLEAIQLLSDRGVTVIYISHDLDQVRHVCDRITVLRDGRVVGSYRAATVSVGELVRAAVGEETGEVPDAAARRTPGMTVLEVDGLCPARGVGPLSFRIRAGEIYAIAGLPGSGKSSVGYALFGQRPASSGVMRLSGSSFAPRHAGEAIRRGVALVPQSRADALVMCRSVTENVTLPALTDVSRAGVIDSGRECRRVRQVIEALGIRVRDLAAKASTLSGGNQQKLVFGRWTQRMPRLLIVDEPTRGIDVTARSAVHGILVDLASRGVAVLMLTMETDDVLQLADRILVLRRGRPVGEFRPESLDHRRLASLMMSGTQGSTG